jgi:hypothetical protein
VECAKHTEKLVEYFQKTGRDNVLESLLVNFKESENSNSSSKVKDDTGKYPGMYLYCVESI